MRLVPLSLAKAVGPVWAEEVFERLTREMFSNLRFAMAGLVGALVLYYVMLAMDSGFRRYLPWMIAQLSVNLVIVGYNYVAEKWIANTRRRASISVASASANGLLLGLGFLAHFSLIQNPKLQIAIVALVVGVTGAGAFTLACHRFSFITFTVPWLMPISVYLILFSHEIGYIILGAMSVPYLGVLTVLCWKDYERRVELIRAELISRDERNAIAHSLQLVQELKEQQDHDYYLTSQLIKPFAVNSTGQSQNLHVDFLTRQKKQFLFRNEKVSIGGDLSLAHTLKFAGRATTIVVNADAMGKSIQGAGGCLVFGAVFQAIVDRSTLRENTDAKQWLKETVIELQKIFETFDCSMLVSAFFFVVDDATGKFHFINAEHPKAVLFRNHRADFLVGKNRLLKLGMPDFSADFELNSGRLEPGDVLIIGSDGRDDIVQGELPNGNQRINTDAAKFLANVERGGGELEKIADAIASSGEVSDDLSLIRIEYRRATAGKQTGLTTNAVAELREARAALESGDTIAAERIVISLSKLPLRRSAGIACLKLALQIRNFLLAGIFADRLAAAYPSDSKALFWSAHTNFYLGNTELAFEQLRRADPSGRPPRMRKLPAQVA